MGRSEGNVILPLGNLKLGCFFKMSVVFVLSLTSQKSVCVKQENLFYLKKLFSIHWVYYR